MGRHPIRFFSLNVSKVSVTFGLLFSHFAVRILKRFLSAMRRMLAGPFHSAVASPLELTLHSAHHCHCHSLSCIFLGETSFIWMSDTPASATCSEFRSFILEKSFSLGYIHSSRFIIKTCSVGPIIGEFFGKG